MKKPALPLRYDKSLKNPKIYSGGEDGSINMWDLESLLKIHDPEKQMIESSNSVASSSPENDHRRSRAISVKFSGQQLLNLDPNCEKIHCHDLDGEYLESFEVPDSHSKVSVFTCGKIGGEYWRFFFYFTSLYLHKCTHRPNHAQT